MLVLDHVTLDLPLSIQSLSYLGFSVSILAYSDFDFTVPLRPSGYSEPVSPISGEARLDFRSSKF